MSDTVRVPREPTKAMKEAGGNEFMAARDRHSTTEWQDAERIYNAMLSAAPQSSDGWIPLEPTKEMIEAGAQRLVRWETGKEIWPTSWSALDVSASRNDAERVWRSMWLAASPSPPEKDKP